MTIFNQNTEADRDYRFFGGDVEGLQARVERMAALTVQQIEAGEAGVAANLAAKVFQAARSLERAQEEEFDGEPEEPYFDEEALWEARNDYLTFLRGDDLDPMY